MHQQCSQCGHAWQSPLPQAAGSCPACGALLPPEAVSVRAGAGQTDAPVVQPLASSQPLAPPPLPPPVPVAAPPTDAQPQSAESLADNQEPAGGYPRRFPFQFVFFLVLMLFLLAVGVAAVALLATRRGQARRPYDPWADAGNQYVSNEAVSSYESAGSIQWLPAAEGGIRIGPARVDIKRAEFGEARGKDASGMVIISDREYLSILLEVRNESTRPFRYQSWYGNEFTTGSENDSYARVRLWDSARREHPWIIFDDVVSVRWHVPQAVIEPGKSVEDVIIFNIPDEIDRAAIDYFHMELPAAAVGETGFYHFELPAGMIEDSDAEQVLESADQVVE